MKNFFKYMFLGLLLLGVFVGGWRVGVAMTPTPDPQQIVVIQHDTTIVSQSVITLDTLVVTEIDSSIYASLDGARDTVLLLREALKAYLKLNEIALVARDTTRVDLHKATFTQCTEYNYDSEAFKFDYMDIVVTQEVVKPTVSWLDYTNINMGATSDLHGYVLVCYKGYSVGYKTDNTVMLGVNLNLGRVWHTIRRK